MTYIENGKELLRLSQEASTGYQRHQKIRRELFLVAKLNQKRLRDWSVEDILDFILGQIRASSRRPKNKTIMLLVTSVKDVFNEFDIDTFKREAKAISCSMNYLRTQRLRELDSKERTEKPRLIRVQTWRRLLTLILGPMGSTEREKAWNRVVGVTLVWALASGGRIADVLALEKRDIFEVDVSESEKCLNCEIRSGKSNRYGNRDSRLVLFRKRGNEIFCPIETYEWLWKDFPFLGGGKFAIPNPDDPAEKIETPQIMSRVKNRCKILDIPDDQVPMAHSARAFFINYALQMNVPAERIAKSVNWSSTDMIQHYIQNIQYLETAPNRTIASNANDWENLQEEFIPIRKESFYM